MLVGDQRLLRRGAGYLPMLGLFALLGVLIVLPLGLLLYASFTDTPPRPGALGGDLTLQNYRALFSPNNLAAVRNSMIIGVGGTALALGLGAALAWLAARTDVPGKWLVQLAGIVPLFVSSLVGALAWSLIASPNAGYLNVALREIGSTFVIDIYSLPGMIFVFGLYYAPYAFLFLYSALELMNPELEEAAQVHGAGVIRTLRKVTFPLVAPAWFGAAVLTFILIVENFPVPQVLGSPAGVETIPSFIFRLMASAPSRPNEASAIGMILTLMLIGALFVQSRVLGRRQFVTVSGKGFRPRVIKLERWRWPAFGFAAIYLFLAVVVPFFALIQSALRRHQYLADLPALFDTSAFSFDNFINIWGYAPFTTGLRNSIILGFGTAIIGGGLHLLLSYYVYRTKAPARKVIEGLAMAPAAVPALVIGVAFLWTWITLPVPLYGTLLILLMAYVTRFMPQGFRGVSSTIQQVHKDLEESAYVCGASRLRAAVKITFPLIRTGLVSTMLLLFILSMRELSAAIFLYTQDTRVLAITIYDQWDSGFWPRAAAISIVYSLVLLALTLIGRRWFGINAAHD